MITLTLLHPLQDIPVQSWSFSTDSTIRVGRSSSNEVVLYSAVVSRHHLQLEYNDGQWVITNIGSNGTYVNGEKIEKAIATNGMIVRLASAGPKIKIKFDEQEEDTVLRRRNGKARKLKSTTHQTLVRWYQDSGSGKGNLVNRR